MSSHQTVVSTTVDGGKAISEGVNRAGKTARTRRRKLGVYTLAHDALQSYACAQKSNGRKRHSIRPTWVAPVGSKICLLTLPHRHRRRHGERRLEEGAEEEPGTRLRTHAVADTAEEGTAEESQERAERLLVGNVEAVVVAAAWLGLE
jgi:hypothetical protein